MQQCSPFGTCKIKDGLYIGDEYTAKDLEFIVANKVGYVVNCSSEQLENLFEGVGVLYFSFQWPEDQPELVLQEDFISHAFEFIEESVEQGQSCLIASQHGQSRACSLVSLYLMKKFKWSLYKTLEYLNSRRNDLEIKTSFFQVLTDIEIQLNKSTLSTKWEINRTTPMEEIIVINTYWNAQSQSIDTMYLQQEEFMRMQSKETDTMLKWSEHDDDINNNRQHNVGNLIKSILKGSKGIFYKEQPQQSIQQQYTTSTQQQPQRQYSQSHSHPYPPTQMTIQFPQPQPIQPPLQPPQRKTVPKSQSINKENQPDVLPLKKAVIPKAPMRSISNPKAKLPPKRPSSGKQVGNTNKTQNQVVIPNKILRPRMPNFDLI